jgi:hypothetical protein
MSHLQEKEENRIVFFNRLEYFLEEYIEEVEDNEKYGFSRKKQGILDNIHKKLEEIQELIEELKL